MPGWHRSLAEIPSSIYAFCLGRIYRVEEIDAHGLFVLDVSADVDHRFGGFSNDIRLEGEFLDEVDECEPMTHMAMPHRVTYAAVTAGDFEELLALRLAAMRASLEHLGRFDPARARRRLWHSFLPEHTQFIVVEGHRIGFHTFFPDKQGFYLNHLYIHPAWQGTGIGSQVLRQLLAQADALRQAVSLCALRDSPANAFYQRHGFVQTRVDEPDIYYVRAAPAPVD